MVSHLDAEVLAREVVKERIAEADRYRLAHGTGRRGTRRGLRRILPAVLGSFER